MSDAEIKDAGLDPAIKFVSRSRLSLGENSQNKSRR
jgi:hypothetical protein